MSTDKMQDVAPIVFDFKQGESPTSTKFTGWIEQTDTAFGKLTGAIGDPWEYAQHTGGPSSAAYTLSPERLTIPTLARMIGPSDYISPSGASFSQSPGSATIRFTLLRDRNSWCLGVPLVKVTGSITPSAVISGNISNLSWGTDVTVVTDTGSVLTTEQTDAEDVVSTGDFHVDYKRGVITTFDSPTSDLVFDVSNLYVLTSGPPWSAHNVIPTWKQTLGLCNVHTQVDYATTSTYLIDLPVISTQPRHPSTTTVSGGQHCPDIYSADVSCNAYVLGNGYNYRLPYSLTSVLSDGDQIPTGFMYLWDESAGRFVQQVTFYYKTATRVQVSTPSNWLTLGDSTYRIIISAISIAEAIEYLSDVVRDNRHVGLTGGASAPNTIAYTPPISHNDLVDNFGGYVATASLTYPDKFIFRKSSYPINDHPQYLHRAGYMDDDEDGNTGNAMRGDIVFAEEDTCTVGTSALYTATHGIMFGGHSLDSSTGHPRIAWEGGVNNSWTSGVAVAFNWGLSTIGASPGGSSSAGAITVTPWDGMPLYLRGRNHGTVEDAYQGAVLGFDLKRNTELNYIKLLAAYRTGTYDTAITAANTGQASFSTELEIMPDITNRISKYQVREFRFRGVAYCSTATNNGIGSSGTELNKYFMSPAMVGAEFINLYGNAIFFSETGDGSSTSYSDRATVWLDSGGDEPAGIYYLPYVISPSQHANCKIVVYEGSSKLTPAQFGYDCSVTAYNDVLIQAQNSGGILLSTDASTTTVSNNDILLEADNDILLRTRSTGGGILLTTNTANPTVADGYIEIYSTNDTQIVSLNNIILYANGTGGILLSTDATYTSTGSQDVLIASDNDVLIHATDSGGILLSTDASTTTVSNNDILLEADNDILLRTRSTGGGILLTTNTANPTVTDGYIEIYSTNNTEIISLNDIILFANGTGGILLSTDNSTTTVADDNIVIKADDSAYLWAKGDVGTGHAYVWAGTNVYLESLGAGYVYSDTILGNTGITTNDVYISNTGQLGVYSSSRRYKTNIEPVTDTSWLYELEPVVFNFKKDLAIKHYGFIAEDVAEICEEGIVRNKNNEPEGLEKMALLTAAITEIQKLRKEIDELKQLKTTTKRKKTTANIK